MAQEEISIQQWIKDHPQSSSMHEQKIHFPSLNGFQPAGDPVQDRKRYKIVKEQYITQQMRPQQPQLSAEALQAARLQHKVTLVQVSNQSK